VYTIVIRVDTIREEEEADDEARPTSQPLASLSKFGSLS